MMTDGAWFEFRCNEGARRDIPLDLDWVTWDGRAYVLFGAIC